MIECKYLLKVKFMGFLVLMIFFCGQRALAGSDRVSLAKLSAQLRWGAENHSTGQQFDGRWQEGILYAVQVVGARIEQCLQSGKISDARVKNEVLAAIDSINKELAQYASRLGITISIVRPRGELPRVDLLNKQGEGAVAGYPVPVPYLLFRLGNGELTEERTVLFNLCPQKLAIGWLQDQLGIEEKDIERLNRLKANKFWVAGQKAVGYLLRTSERGADAWKMGLIHFAQRIYAKNPVLYEDIDWNIISVLWDHEPVLRLLNEVFFKFRGSLKAISFIHEQGFSLLRAARIDREGTAEFVEYVDAVGEELFCGLVRDIGAELCKSVFVNNPKGCSRLLLNYASCNETLASEWKDHFGALNGLLGEPQIKLLLGQLPRELAWAFKIEMLQIFREGECPDPLVAVAPLLDKYWRLLQALDIYHRYLETVGIEVEVFNGVEDFDRYLAKIVSCLLDIDLGRDQGVLLEYSPAPVSHYSLYGPLIQLLRTSSLVQILPEKSCTSFHLSLPFDEGGERAVGNISNRGDIDMLAVTIGLLYMADERASQGDRVSQVLRKRKQGTRRTAADIVKYGLAHKYPRQRFELRHGSFSKKTQVKKEIVREEEVIRVTQILYSCFSMFLNSVEHCQADPVRLRMRELWIDFYQGYQRIMSQIVFPRARTFQLWKMRRAKRDLWKMISIRRQHPNVVMELRGLVEKICLEVEMMLDELVERRIAVGDLSAIGELLENSCLKSV